MRIDVIVNTTARLYRERPRMLDRVRRLCAGAARLHVTGSLEDLDVACRAIAGDGSDLVALSGGDGTFMAGVTALARSFGEPRLPTIAVIPGGTVATVARNWGVRGDASSALRALLRDPASLRATRRSTLRVRERSAAGTVERIGFIFGTGLVARFFDVYYAQGARGYPGAARIVARVFLESFVSGPFARSVLDPLPCAIEVDGRPLEPRAWSLVCAAVVRNLGIGMRVTYRAGEDPKRVHLVASPLSTRELGPRAPLVLAGRRIGGAGHVDDLVERFVVRFPSEGPYVLDGDVLRASEVEVAPGPFLDVVAL